VLVALLAAGCGRAVAVEPLPQDAGSAQRCADLVAAAPPELPAGRAWTVSPDPTTTAAWGSPAVVLRCGAAVPQPPPQAQLLAIDGVDWWIVQLTDGDRYTTVGRWPGVEVRVPGAYAPSAQVVAALTPAVAAGTRVQP
jgi:hypothetical protein